MALAPYNITALEEDFATAQLSGKNIVAGALITLATTGGTPVSMADDSAGSNPSLTKLTDALGQKVIWVAPDTYDLTVDGNTSIRIQVSTSDITPSTQAALDLKADAASLGTASTADLTTSSTDTTAGRVTKVGDFGLGDAGVLIADLDSFDTVNGYYSTNASSFTTTANPTNRSSNAVIVSRMTIAGYITQIMSNVDGTVLTRQGDNSTWTPWVEILTTANTNFTTFGGVSAGDLMATGYAVSATTAYFYIPISLVNPPSSITVTAAFDVTTPNSTLKANAVTSLVLQGTTSNKWIRIQVTGMSGLTANEPLELRTDSATSKIVVNV